MIWRCILLLMLFSKVLVGQNLDSLFKDNPYRSETIGRQFLDEAKWEGLVSELDYSVKKVPDRSYSTKYLFSILGIIALAILIAVLAAFLGGFFVKKKKVDQKLQVSIEEAQQNILESDLDQLLAKVLNEESYALATRIYFLKALKELSNHKKIAWNKDKTNRKYYYELGSSPLAAPFAQLAVIFDRLTYRGDTLDRSEFQTIEAQFQSFFKAIPQNPQNL